MASDLIFELSPTQKAFVQSTAHINHLTGPMGEGKCLKKGTPVLMYDGTIVPVEKIKQNDLLMGDDSKPRHVSSVVKGYGQLYRVTPIRGDSFVCNAEHILSLKRTGLNNTKRGKPVANNHKGEITDIALKDFVTRSKHFRDTQKLYRVPADFEKQSVCN